LVKSQVLSSEWKTDRVREDASGDREDGKEDDDDMQQVVDIVWPWTSIHYCRQFCVLWRNGWG